MESRIMKTYKIALLVLASAVFSSAVYAAQGYAVMIQQSPADAGQVTPGTGVHRYGLNESVPIRAIPKPGFKFVQWLGDVTESTTNKTTIIADSPKIVIAIFEEDKFPEFKSGAGGGGPSVAGGSEKSSSLPGRTVSNAVRVGSGGSVSAASSGSYDAASYVYNIDANNNQGNLPVSGEGIPVAGEGETVPEPATLLMLGLGSAVLLRRK